MTTQEAFSHLTKQKKWYDEFDLTPENARQLKGRVIKGKSLVRAQKMLKKAGYTEKPSAWTAPNE